jgi:hypothetical protein
MDEPIDRILPLLFNAIACSYRYRQAVSHLGKELGRVVKLAGSNMIVAELSRGAKETYLSLEDYEAACYTAVLLLRYAELDAEEPGS